MGVLVIGNVCLLEGSLLKVLSLRKPLGPVELKLG